jgi:xanthine dehydrogenase YagR molybdenum-binding subunit
MSLTGQPLDRTDGIAKVTGAAPFSAEHAFPRLAHAVIVTSTIPSGRIGAIDTAAAEKMNGVLAVMTHLNAPRLPKGGRAAAGAPPAGRTLTLLQDDEVHYNNQPIAVVVADTLEHARDAANHVHTRYQASTSKLDFNDARKLAHSPGKVQTEGADSTRGDYASGLGKAASQIEAVYRTPAEHHNPMEPHATIAVWDGDHLTLYDSTQYVTGVQTTIARTFGIPPEKVRAICPFTGGGFGCKGSTWSHVALAAMAAKMTARPVKLELERPQMFGSVGGRPNTEQRLVLATQSDGRLTAMRHDVISSTSMIEDWTEPSAMVSRMLYAVPNQETTHRLAKLNIGTPTFMRAPGESTGSYALECAMDELAIQLKMDPIQLRLQNYAESDPKDGKPWSSKSLRECYRVGAEKFGWNKRNPAPRSMRSGNTLVGMGMATATYPAKRSPASAMARILPDGTAMVQSGSQDLGTGTYTVMTQVAADALGFPMNKVRFELGDSTMPKAPVSGGSQSAASVAPAVQAACVAARAELIGMAAADPESPFSGVNRDDIDVVDGWLVNRASPSRREPIAAVIARRGGKPIEARADSKPGDEDKNYSMHSFGAVFAEVHVDIDLGEIRVPRVVAAYGVGQLLNKKAGHSQLMGGIVWGVGMALLEKTEYDLRTGRILNANLAEYHVPVNADIGAIDITVLDEKENRINALGAKGIGEIGITAVAAAIANAVYHATGKGVRDLPITLEKVMVQASHPASGAADEEAETGGRDEQGL